MIIDFTPLFDQMQAVYDMQVTVSNSQTAVYQNFDKLIELITIVVFAQGGIIAILIMMLIAVSLKRG